MTDAPEPSQVMDDLRERGLEDKIEVYIDGGIRRGTDIFKASRAPPGWNSRIR